MNIYKKYYVENRSIVQDAIQTLKQQDHQNFISLEQTFQDLFDNKKITT